MKIITAPGIDIVYILIGIKGVFIQNNKKSECGRQILPSSINDMDNKSKNVIVIFLVVCVLSSLYLSSKESHATVKTIIHETNFEMGLNGWMRCFSKRGEINCTEDITIVSREENLSYLKMSINVFHRKGYKSGDVEFGIYNNISLPSLGTDIPIYLSFDTLLRGGNLSIALYGYIHIYLLVSIARNNISCTTNLMKYEIALGEGKISSDWRKINLNIRGLSNLNGFDIAGSGSTIYIKLYIEYYGVNSYDLYMLIDNIKIWVPIAKNYLLDIIPPYLTVKFNNYLFLNQCYIYTNLSTISITWEASDNTRVWRIYIYYNGIFDITNLTKYTIRLSNDVNKLSIVAEDIAGNRCEKEYYVIRVLNRKPPPKLINKFIDISDKIEDIFLSKNNLTILYKIDTYGKSTYYNLIITILIITSFISLALMAWIILAVKRIKIVDKRVFRLFERMSEIIYSKLSLEADSHPRISIGKVENRGYYEGKDIDVAIEVKDILNDMPIYNATIYVDKNNYGITNSKGNLTFKIGSGKHKIRVEHPEYKSYESDLTITKNLKVQIRLFKKLGYKYGVNKAADNAVEVLLEAWKKLSNRETALAVEWADDAVERVLQSLKVKFLPDKLQEKMERQELIDSLLGMGVEVPLVERLKLLRTLRNKVRYQLYKPDMKIANEALQAATIFMLHWVSEDLDQKLRKYIGI